MLSDKVAEAFGLIHRHPSGENFCRVEVINFRHLLSCDTIVEKKKAPLKASTVLNKVTPTPLATSSNSTKSTKPPSLGSQRKSSSKLSPQQNKTTSTKPPPRPSQTRNKPSN